MYCWLDGKTVVVTGASGGMGAGIAATLIKKHGCTVIGVARSEPKMLKFIEELGPTYAQQFSYKLFDVSVKENWENFYNELVEEGVQVDVLVNNAGILPKFKRFDRYSDEFRGKCYVGLVCPGFTKTDIFRGQSNAGGKGEKVINMISTDCDLMVKMIMFGIEHKQALQIHGVDAHAMSVFGKLLPVNGSRLFSAVMKAADIDLFKEVFKDDVELAE